MVEKITYIESGQFHPYKNLAVEEYLLLHCEPQECILYLDVYKRQPHDTFEEESNSKIKKFVEENDHTYLIDWYAASEGHDEYFDADDTHLLSAGAKAYAKCIKEAVLDAYKKENIEIPKSRLVSSTDTSTDSSNDSSTNASTE